MSESPWIKFYASDWLAGTSGLTAAERGVYITILALIYEANEPIAFDEARLARRCGIPKASFRRSVDGLCDEGKLSLRDGKLSNKRAEKEISDRADRSQNATIAANKRWKSQDGKSEQNQGPSDAPASATQCDTDANQNQNQNQIKKEEPNGSLAIADETAEAVHAYNEAANVSGWPKVQKLTTSRRSSLNARLREAGGIEGWRIAISKASASDFLCGRSGRDPFFASFDFLTRQSSFTKLMEGSYDNRDRPLAASSSPSGYGQGGSLASIAARRRASGAV